MIKKKALGMTEPNCISILCSRHTFSVRLLQIPDLARNVGITENLFGLENVDYKVQTNYESLDKVIPQRTLQISHKMSYQDP